MTEDEYHIKENLLDSEWRSQNGVTIKSFVDLILDSYSSTKQERKEMKSICTPPFFQITNQGGKKKRRKKPNKAGAPGS